MAPGAKCWDSERQVSLVNLITGKRSQSLNFSIFSVVEFEGTFAVNPSLILKKPISRQRTILSKYAQYSLH